MYDEIQGKIDTVIAYSMAELENLDIRNKNLIYLGHEDIHNIDVQGSFGARKQGNGKLSIIIIREMVLKFR